MAAIETPALPSAGHATARTAGPRRTRTVAMTVFAVVAATTQDLVRTS